jgi:HemY protein
MRRIVVFLVVAAALIAFAWWLADLPGMVSAQIGNTSFAASTPVAALAAIVLFILAYLIVRLLVMVLRLPSRTRRMRAARERKRGETAVTRTLLALASGDAQTARREAQRSRSLLGDTPQTLLLAAYAGRQAGQQEEAEAAFNLLAARKDAAFLGLRGLIQGAMARGEWEAAAALSRQAEETNPGAPWLRAERARLAIRAGSWKQALELSGPGDPVATLGTAAANAETTSPAEARRMAKRAWMADQSFAPAALAYARRLRDIGRESRAQDVLRIAWGLAPHPALAEAAMGGGTYAISRQRRAESLAAAAPEHPESLFLLAKTELETGRLAEAARHAAAARDAGMDQRRLWLLMATIAERAGDREAQEDSLRHAASAEPDSRWRCETCGTAQAEWQPVCSACSAVGTVAWGGAADGANRLMLVHSGDPILP